MKHVRFALMGLIAFHSAHSFTLSASQQGWENRNLAINVNMTNCPSDILERLDDAFKLWNSVATSSLKLSLGSTTSTTTGAQLKGGSAADSPVVICDSQFGTTFSKDPNSIAGVGFASPVIVDGPLVYGGLALNVQSGGSANIAQTTVAIRNVVVAHEIGHMLGLGHSSSQTALMYYSAGSQEYLSLSKDDWDGISYLYPRDELSKTNLAAGCGLVQNQENNLPRALISILMLLLPMIFWLKLRYGKSRKLQTANSPV